MMNKQLVSSRKQIYNSSENHKTSYSLSYFFNFKICE